MRKRRQQATMANTDGQNEDSFWRRLSWWSLLILMITLLAWGWIEVHNPHVMPIKRIKIQGSYQRVDQQALKKAVLPYAENGFFNIDMVELRDRLLQLPWVADVSVRRVWPSTLALRITQQQVLARWDEGSLLSADGEVFTPRESSIPTGLPLFIGPDGQRLQMIAAYQTIERMLQPLSLRVNELQLSPRRSWSIRLNNGMQIMLGRVNMQQRLQRFVEVYPELFANKKNVAKYVDLRYTNGIAVG